MCVSYMEIVSKMEFAKLKEFHKDLECFKTMKQKSSRGKIYIPEYKEVMSTLAKIRVNGEA